MNEKENMNTSEMEVENTKVESTEVKAEETQEMSMEDAMKDTNMTLKTGDIVTGKVIKVTPEEVFVNINYMSDGVIPKIEFMNDQTIDLQSVVKEDDEVKVLVKKINNGEGNVLLSKRGAEAEESVSRIEKALAEGTPVTAKVREAVKGGLRVDLKGVQGFMPASLASSNFIPDLTVLQGKEMEVQVIEFDRAKKRAVVSRKELEKIERAKAKEEAFKTLTKGSTVDGKVTKLMNYGAFIDIGGVEGLAHISDLSWSRIKHPSEVIKEGDEVKVLIQDINESTGKISLSLKTDANNPWKNIEKYQVGQSYPGKIMNIIKSGAFVELEPGLEGYLHISELSSGNVEKVEDVVTIGQEVNVRIREINTENKKLSLSMREPGEERERDRDRDRERAPRKDRTEKFEAFRENSKNNEKRPRRERQERGERVERGGRKGAGIDRGYHDTTDNLTIGDLFGDLKSKFNFDEE